MKIAVVLAVQVESNMFKKNNKKLFMTILLLSLSIISGCGGESKEAKEARLSGIEELNAGNYEEAIESFRKALDESDGIVGTFEKDILKYRAEAEYKLEDYQSAANTYEILADIDGGKAEYLYYKAASEAMSGQLENAKKDLAAADDKVNGKKKNNSEVSGVTLAYTALASCARDAGDGELATDCCNQAIERGISGPEIYNQLAMSEMEAGDYDSAMSHYEEALSLADADTALIIQQNIAVLYEKQGEFSKALENFEECQASGADTEDVKKEIRFLKSRVAN